MKDEKKHQKEKGKPIESRLLGETQAGEYLAVSRSQIRAFVRAGLLHPVHLPHQSGAGFINRVLYDIHDLDCFVEKCKKTQPAKDLVEDPSAA
jgi:hypothetical protein